MNTPTESIRSTEQAKPLKDRKEETARNINFYAARIKAKRINRIYYLDDLQELYQNLHELFHLTKQHVANRNLMFGKIELTTAINEWLNERDIAKKTEYGINLSLAYLDALIIKDVIKP